MRNLLLEPVEYQVERTRLGTWRRHLSAGGRLYREFTSHRRIRGMPLLHFTAGVCPETGRRKVARGFIAVGRVAVGVIAVGQLAFGVLAVGQAGLGLLAGLGQLATGCWALGQVAVGVGLAVGQVAVAWTAVGQLAAGHWVLAQLGLGAHVWMPRSADPAAVEYFGAFLRR